MSDFIGSMVAGLAGLGRPTGWRPSRQDGPWAAPPRRSRTRTFGRFEALREQHPDWSTARIRSELHSRAA